MAVKTTAMIGHGATIGYSTTGAAPYTAVGLVTKIGPPDEQTEKPDSTHLLSPNFTREKIAGLNHNEDATLTVQLTYAGYSALQTLKRTLCSWQIMIPDGTSSTTGSTFTFSGFLTDLHGDIPDAEIMTVSVSIAVTGPVVVATGS
jgi:Lambda phage tail tube protein, TTP